MRTKKIGSLPYDVDFYTNSKRMRKAFFPSPSQLETTRYGTFLSDAIILQKIK